MSKAMYVSLDSISDPRDVHNHVHGSSFRLENTGHLRRKELERECRGKINIVLKDAAYIDSNVQSSCTK